MQDELAVLQEQAEYSRISKSGLSADKLYAVQGWLPQRQVDSLADDLKKANVDVAVETIEPAEDEQPPTLIEYPKWAQPIEGLFNILGTVPGYREFDVAAPFMIALPIFAAMLIADGGYGAILFLVPLLGYKKIAPAMGEQFTKLMIVIGGVALLWGFLCGSFFGVTIYDPPIPVNLTESSRRLLMHISFIMGAIHLAIAQLWQAVALYPNQRFLNKVGWAVFIWGVFGIVELFVLKNSFGWGTPWPYFLILGAILTIGFASDSTNWPKRFGLGVADFPLSLLSAFSDVISYVRLMAVGLASSVLAANFNELAFSVGFLPLTMLVLLFGHGLNLGLAMIALFAHGVRLNMLEFSNNLGMQWTGYAYNPFLKRTIQET
jgi:V/A-type H+-transporting ATPase subunit I